MDNDASLTISGVHYMKQIIVEDEFDAVSSPVSATVMVTDAI